MNTYTEDEIGNPVEKENVPDINYGVGGQLKDDCQEHCIYAKRVHNGKWFEYHIRYAIAGPDTPHLLNPWGVNFLPGISDKKIERSRGKRTYEFKKVPEKAFNLYISYLKTRNASYYREAERSLD